MIISHKYKFIFIKTFKTAGTSIETYLSQHCGQNDILTPIYPQPKNHQPRNFTGFFNPLLEIVGGTAFENKCTFLEFVQCKRFYNHISARKVKCRIGSQIWNTYYKFAVDRHPIEKTISHYSMLKHRSDNKLTVNDYFKNNQFCLNYHKYTKTRNSPNIIVDKVIRYENLHEELGVVFHKLGIPYDGTLGEKEKISYRNQNVKSDNYFSEMQKEQLRTIFKTEIEMHGYVF